MAETTIPTADQDPQPPFASPWREGERRIQESLGVRERMENSGRKIVRPFMPEQHRAFYAQLPFMLVGTVDAEDRPWASVLVGRPGFAEAAASTSLRLDARLPAEDPAAAGIAAGAPLGLLGIELHSRRRNRLNGTVAALDAGGLTLSVGHSYGNCPQYIQTRDFEFVREPGAPGAGGAVERSDGLSPAARAIIERADAFFVASYSDDAEAGREVDVSHRGGKAGFVRIGADGLLTVPDFAGNLFFNTLGNILTTGRAGLLFLDFETGDALQISGTAEVLLDSPEIAAFQGAERLWTVRPETVVLRRDALPLRWRFDDWSPNSLMTGDWDAAAARLAAEAKRQEWRPFRVAKIVEEAAGIRSFHLEPADGAGFATYEAGQHLPIRLAIPGEGRPALRTYTLSSAPSDPGYRISVKRDGKASSFLHDHVAEGDVIEAQAPRGGFTVDAAERRPLALLSAGVGITPMLSMLRHVVYEGLRTRRTRPVWFFHGARTLAERPFAAEIAELVGRGQDQVRALSALSAPDDGLTPGDAFDHAGRIDLDLLKRTLPFDDFDFYLCGPGPFMQALYDALREIGVRDARIFAEAFGPSALTRRPDATETPAPAGPPPALGPAPVLFAESGKEARWSPEKGTLLELAEERGLAPPFSCRSGSCGSCRTKVLEGSVAYASPVSAEVGADEALICCAVPAQTEDGSPSRVVLDL